MASVSTQIPGPHLAAVFAGGVLGTAARAGVGEALPHTAGTWPWATLLVNLAGAALLGIVVARVTPATRARALLGPGLCGGLTTFSTLQLELLDLLDAGRPGLAAAYVAASVAGGLAGVAAGRRAAA